MLNVQPIIITKTSNYEKPKQNFVSFGHHHKHVNIICYKHTRNLTIEAKELLKEVTKIFLGKNDQDVTLSVRTDAGKIIQLNKALNNTNNKISPDYDYHINSFELTDGSYSFKPERDTIFNIKGEKMEVPGKMTKEVRQGLMEKLVEYLKLLKDSGEII